MRSRISATELVEQIDAVVVNMEGLVRDLTPDQQLWRPRPDSWSIAECLDHLNRTASLYIKAMRVSFERERHNASLPGKTFHVGFIARQFVGMLEPPYRVKAKATSAILPTAAIRPPDVAKEFYRLRLELRGFVLEASHVDMGAIRFTSPLASILKLNLAEGTAILAAHDRRHLWQAENVKATRDFPAPEAA